MAKSRYVALGLCLAAAGVGGASAETLIALEARQVPLGQVLTALSRQSGVDVRVADGWMNAYPVSLMVTNASLESALKTLLGSWSYTLTFEQIGGKAARVIISAERPAPNAGPIAWAVGYRSTSPAAPVDPLVVYNPLPTPEQMQAGTVPARPLPAALQAPAAPVDPLVVYNPLPTPEQMRAGTVPARPLPAALQAPVAPVDPLVWANPLPIPRESL